MEKTVLNRIHETYQQRCDHPERQKAAWRDTIAPAFPPDLNDCEETRPSVLLAGESGDLGCALLWIVQAALVRPFLELVSRQADLTPDHASLLGSFSKTDCGALAHSEPKEVPVVLSTDSAGLRLNGMKRYITAGSQSDFILITARAPHDEKVSRLLLMPTRTLMPPEMETLGLNALRTTSHGRLTMERKTIPAHYLLPLTPSMIRKALKVNGLIERSLILEAVPAFMTYLNRRLTRHMSQPPADEIAINELAVQQTEYATAAIRQARDNQMVRPQWIDLNTVNNGIEHICHASADLDPAADGELLERINDLRFIRSLWG